MSSEQQSDEAAGATTPANMTNPNGSLIGYCHQCDRQVEIDPDFFTCKGCNSGFIELFEGNDAAEEAAETEINNPHANIFRFDNAGQPNFENLANQFLPLLFPQLINQMTRANQSSGDSGAGAPMPTGATGGASNTAQPRNAQIQFFVPAGENPMNEQIDLYGIINNVVSDLLNQRTPNNNPFFLQQPFRMVHLHGDARDYAWGPGGLDTIITQLLNQLENTGPPPATDDDMRKLPTVVITEQDVENKVQCAICMEEFAAKSEAKKLPCKHLFHEACIVQWLQRHGTCPVCRKHLNGEDTTQNEYVSPANVEAAANATSNQQAANSNPATNNSATRNTTNDNTTTSGGNGGNSGSSSNNFYTDMDFD